MLKTVFMGTPSVAVPFLDRLAETSRVLGVVTGPDRPVGRGYALTPPPVKKRALERGLPVAQPERLKEFSFHDAFGATPDVGIVVAYGHLIPAAVFGAPRHGLVNVHFSLVPKYRGAGPMQWALIRGETETGVSLFQIEKGLDTGPVFLQKPVGIDPADNAVSLEKRLVDVGLALQTAFLTRLEQGPWSPTPQTGEPTDAPLLRKEDGHLYWSRHSAAELANLIRGTYGWPGAFTFWKGHRVKIRAALPRAGGKGRPGEILGLERGAGLVVKCLSDSLVVSRLQPDGKKEMDADSFWNGARPAPGQCFTEENDESC